MPVDEPLIQAAIEQAARRWPEKDAAAAAIRIEGGDVLTGVPLANFNAAMTLCVRRDRAHLHRVLERPEGRGVCLCESGLEGLAPPRRQAPLAPDPGDPHVRDPAEEIVQQPARPVRHTEPLRRRLQRGQHVATPEPAARRYRVRRDSRLVLDARSSRPADRPHRDNARWHRHRVCGRDSRDRLGLVFERARLVEPAGSNGWRRCLATAAHPPPADSGTRGVGRFPRSGRRGGHPVPNTSGRQAAESVLQPRIAPNGTGRELSFRSGRASSSLSKIG